MNANYFSVLGVDQGYSIDRKALEDAYFAACKNNHPDKVDESKRLHAVQVTALINDAYKTLKNPEARAEHLLAQHGLTISEHDSVPQTFLIEMLERREALANAAGDDEAIDELRGQMERERRQHLQAIADGFAAYEENSDAAVLTQIKERLLILRYVARYLDACDEE